MEAGNLLGSCCNNPGERENGDSDRRGSIGGDEGGSGSGSIPAWSSQLSECILTFGVSPQLQAGQPVYWPLFILALIYMCTIL